ncbi:hypothetical protein D3C85_1140340 [compost metagenome]
MRADLDGQRDAGAGQAVGARGLGHRPGGEHRKAAHSQAAFFAARQSGQVDLGLAKTGEQQTGMTAHGLAQRGAGGALGRAFEQARADQFLDLGDGAGQTRLRAVQLRGRLGQIAQFGDGQHDFQVPDAELASERSHGAGSGMMCRLFSAAGRLATRARVSDIVRRRATHRGWAQSAGVHHVAGIVERQPCPINSSHCREAFFALFVCPLAGWRWPR